MIAGSAVRRSPPGPTKPSAVGAYCTKYRRPASVGNSIRIAPFGYAEFVKARTVSTTSVRALTLGSLIVPNAPAAYAGTGTVAKSGT